MTRKFLALAFALALGAGVFAMSGCDSNKPKGPTKNEVRQPKSEPRPAPGGAGLTPDKGG